MFSFELQESAQEASPSSSQFNVTHDVNNLNIEVSTSYSVTGEADRDDRFW